MLPMHTRLAQAIRHVPLRWSLVVLSVLLAGLALLASGIAVTQALESSMLARTDRSLLDAESGWARPIGGDLPEPPPSAPGPERPPSRYFVQVRDGAGRVVVEVNDEDTTPNLSGMNAGSPVTVPSVDDKGVPWRAVQFTTSRGYTVTVATPLTENAAVVQRLVFLQIGVGSTVLVLLAVAAYFTVRRSLRPLREVERTAAAIAQGDLSRRVPPGDLRTEVGALAGAVNVMLGQVQTAFAATVASEESAHRSAESMRRFVADASHDLRTPLATIQGFAELYRQGASTDLDHVMGRIEREAHRMGSLVEDLLTLARLDEERPLAQEPVDLLALATDSVRGARVVSPGRAIELEVVPGPGAPVVLGDENRLRQVLDNLVGNAQTHTPSTARITVRVGTRGSDAFLEVCDEGPGLAPEDRARLFERFYRADSSRTSASGGSGLGLSIVDSLVAAHGGRVEVESALGRGSTFRVSIPREPGR